MKEHKDIIDKFDLLLENPSGSTEIEKMEMEIKNDATTYSEFEEHKLLVDGIRYSSRNKLKASISQWDADMTSNRVKQIFLRPFWHYVAASVIMIFAFTAVLIYFSKPENDKLLAQYYQPYNYNSGITRGGDKGENPDFFAAYERGAYKVAIEMFGASNLSGQSDMTDFLYANACQAIGLENLAIPVFQRIASTDSPLMPASKWYLAICYISVDEMENAIGMLQELSTLNSSYSPKAQRLLNDLKN